MAHDLTDAELDELDELLAQTPEPLEPLDLVMLDGYLAGVLVQPRLVPPHEWLPPVFDLEGGALPADVDPAWHARVAELAQRRHAALNESMAEDGWFDPILHEGEVEEPEDAAVRDALREVPAVSRTLFGWAAGFQYACTLFPGLAEHPGEAVTEALDRVFRHLPPETDTERELLAALDEDFPVKTVDEAVEDLVLAVSDLWELTCDERFKVEPVKRETPKVGRNDPCPCGSGKKYKQCHGQ
jgi:uncharacterized protein